MSEDRCVCCGEVIPEGRMVCPQCYGIDRIGMHDVGYQAPIELFVTNVTHQIRKQEDEEIYKAVVHFVPNVDKEELLKALKYDRGQYEKGFRDGKRAAMPAWISVKDRLPDEGKEVLALCWHHESWKPLVCYLSPHFKERWITSIAGQWMMIVSHWMPLPQPPEEVEDGTENC